MSPPNPISPSTDNRLRAVEVAVTAMEKQISTLILDFAELRAKMTIIMDRLEEHNDIFYGKDGKPGLLSNEEMFLEIRDALKGKGKEPGLIAEIHHLSADMISQEDSQKWFTRLVLGAIVADVIIHVLSK